MELIYQISCIILYVLLFSWAFFYVRNVILAKKLKCGEFYKSIKKNFENKKLTKCLWIITIISIIIFVLYIIIGIVVALLTILFWPLALMNSNGVSDFYNNLLNYISIHFSRLVYIGYFFFIIEYIIIFIAGVRDIYVNIKCYKKLKGGNKIIDTNKEKLQNDSKLRWILKNSANTKWAWIKNLFKIPWLIINKNIQYNKNELTNKEGK